jgi:hypothetical protein
MGRLISTYYAENDAGHAEVKFDSLNELFYIKYYDSNGKFFFSEEFPDKSIHYVEDAAENWALGYKVLYG